MCTRQMLVADFYRRKPELKVSFSLIETCVMYAVSCMQYPVCSDVSRSWLLKLSQVHLRQLVARHPLE